MTTGGGYGSSPSSKEHMSTPTQLAQTVLIGGLDRALETWEDSHGCPAWIDSADRRCAKKPAHGYLCTRHHNVAVKRWEKEQEVLRISKERALRYRAAHLPQWKSELAYVQAEINRLDPPAVNTDRAAYGGNVHPSILRKRRAALSDSRVQKMAELWRRHDELTSKIGDEK